MPDVPAASIAPDAAPRWRSRAINWIGMVIAAAALQFAFPCTVPGWSFGTIVVAVGVPGVFVSRLAPLPRGKWGRVVAVATLVVFTATACGANLATHVCM